MLVVATFLSEETREWGLNLHRQQRTAAGASCMSMLVVFFPLAAASPAGLGNCSGSLCLLLC
jgi:hypothetical protein